MIRCIEFFLNKFVSGNNKWFVIIWALPAAGLSADTPAGFRRKAGIRANP